MKLTVAFFYGMDGIDEQFADTVARVVSETSGMSACIGNKTLSTVFLKADANSVDRAVAWLEGQGMKVQQMERSSKDRVEEIGVRTSDVAFKITR